MITAMTLYSCCCCLYNSLILTFCDRDTLQRAYFVGTIISNSSSCIFLVIIALALHGHAPTIAFTREAYIFGFIIALLCAYPLWLHVPEAEAGERAEPVAPSNAVMAIVSGVQALAKNRCDIPPTSHLVALSSCFPAIFPPGNVPALKFIFLQGVAQICTGHLHPSRRHVLPVPNQHNLRILRWCVLSQLDRRPGVSQLLHLLRSPAAASAPAHSS